MARYNLADRPATHGSEHPTFDAIPTTVAPQPLKVLVLSQHYWPEDFRINEVVQSLRACGAEVEVLAGQPNYPKGRIFKNYSAFGCGTQRHPSGYLIHRVPVIPRGDGGSFQRVGNYFSFVLSCSILGPWLLRGAHYDVILVYAISPILQGLPAAFLKLIKKAVLVIWVQDLWPDSLKSTGYVKNEAVLGVIKFVTRFIYRRADLLLAQSQGFIAKIRLLSGPNLAIVYHPNPGDLSLTNELEVADASTSPVFMPADGFNIVFAGNLGSAQALETILGAAERLSDPSIRIYLVGSGSRLDWVSEQIAFRSLCNVVLCGRFPTEAMPAIYASASALLVTLKRDENFNLTIPSKIPSYLAAARPIIACVDGEAAEVVLAASAGLVVPSEDAERLAIAIAELKQMTISERLAMGKNGRAYFEKHFQPKSLAQQMIMHFRDAMEKRRKSSSHSKPSAT